MRDLKRNSTAVYYKNFIRAGDYKDEYGNKTGTPVRVYGEMKSCEMSVSGSKGSADSQAFGIDLDYDRTLSTADMSCEIDEYSILWLDGADLDKEHNYIVKKRSATKNQLLFAVKQVKVGVPA
ncbi:MAG: hypothetical protein IJ740_06070 [Ruminococcus sp.]|nr:hypothetical protein [Ruminococcus sp.]